MTNHYYRFQCPRECISVENALRYKLFESNSLECGLSFSINNVNPRATVMLRQLRWDKIWNPKVQYCKNCDWFFLRSGSEFIYLSTFFIAQNLFFQCFWESRRRENLKVFCHEWFAVELEPIWRGRGISREPRSWIVGLDRIWKVNAAKRQWSFESDWVFAE